MSPTFTYIKFELNVPPERRDSIIKPVAVLIPEY